MRVILSAKSVHPFHPVGGVQKYVYYFAKHLAQNGIDLEIVAPLDNGKPRTETFEGLQYTLLRPAIYRYLEYPVGWLGVHMFSSALNRYLQKRPFDLLHSFDMTGYHYAKNKIRQPIIAHIFTDNYLSNPISLMNPLNLFGLTGSGINKIKEQKIKISPYSDLVTKLKYLPQYLFKTKPVYRCMKQSEAVFFEADIFRNEVNTLYRLNPQKSSVLPVGTDITFIRNVVAAASVSRGDIGLNKEDIVLITVNRLAADKGVDKIVLALEKAVKEDPRLKLIIIGSGYQEKEIYETIGKKGLWGHVLHFKNVPEDKLYQYYNLSDIYVSAFSYPGSSISTLEAMACSLPVITTAQPWLIQDDANGIILGSNSPDAIARAVLRMTREGRLEKKGKASEDIVKNFNWDGIARNAIGKYEEVTRVYSQNH